MSSTRSPGRAGRAGFDTAGFVVAQAPEHVIENEKALAKAGDDPKKRRKVVRKKAPEGFVAWTENTFEKLIASEPEPLTSRFRVTHTMLLSVIARPGNAFEAMRHLLEDNHEPRKQQLRHIRRAIAIYRSLLDGGIVEKLDEPDASGPHRPPHRRSPAGLRAQPAAVHLRAGRVRAAGPGVAVVRPGHGVRRRVHAGRSAADPRRPAEQGARRGRRPR